MESTKTKLNISKTKGNQIHESQSFSYDANGNRLNLTENKDTTDEIQTVYTILENLNRLTNVADTEYQYDNNGNIINDGERSLGQPVRQAKLALDQRVKFSYTVRRRAKHRKGKT